MSFPKNPDALYWKTLNMAEKHMLLFYLQHAGTLTHAATLLGVTKAHVSRRAKVLGIDVKQVLQEAARSGRKKSSIPPWLR